MTFVAAKCPECAGALQVPDDRDTVKCMYCGVDVIVRQAIQLVAGNAKHFLALAGSALSARNFSEAFNYFTRTLEIEPTNADAWLGKGTTAGWQSTLEEFRFLEMMVAYENAIKFAKAESLETMKLSCAGNLTNLATAYHKKSREHMLEYVALPNTWQEYISRCRQCISLYEVAHGYRPKESKIIEAIINLCKDNIEGVKYKDPRNSDRSRVVVLTDNYENGLRKMLSAYAEKMLSLIHI